MENGIVEGREGGAAGEVSVAMKPYPEVVKVYVEVPGFGQVKVPGCTAARIRWEVSV